MPKKKTIETERITRWLRLEKMQLVSLLGTQEMNLKHSNRHSLANDGARLFLSYAHQDIMAVTILYSKLVQSGFRPWMDAKDLSAGENWQIAIEKAIRQCDFFVLCLSPNSIGRRGFLQREIKAAMDRLLEFLDHDIYFVPARLAPCTRPHEIAKYQTVDLFEASGFQSLISALNEGMRRRQLDT